MARRAGKLGTVSFYLDSTVPINERYQRRYRSVDPQSETLSGDVVGLVADAKFRPWVVRNWAKGEGYDTWDRTRPGYRTSNGVIPTARGDGLELARLSAITTITSGGGNLSGPVVLGVAQGSLWAALDDTAYQWDSTNEEWSAGISTGSASSNQVTSIADGQDTWVYSGAEDFKIYRWKSGSQETHYDTSTGDDFTWPPLVRAFGTRIFALDGDQLYEIDKTTADTRTPVASLDGNSANWLSIGPTWQRMCATDVGLAWIQRLDNGDTLIREYNVAADTQDIIGKVSLSWIYPYSIFSAFGYIFVSFRVTTKHTLDGDAYVYFQRGDSRGNIGPIRQVNPPATSGAPTVAGIIGSNIMIAFDDIFAYDFDEGGIIRWGDAQFPGGLLESHALVFAQDVFVCQNSGVYRIQNAKYAASGTIHLGWHDWDYPGLTKTFLDLTVITDPLPAATSITAAVAVDGNTATYTALTGTHETDNATKFTFTVANPTTAPIVGQRFEIRLSFATTNSANTPTVREVSARATGAESVLEVIMQIDAGTAGNQTDETLIAALNGLKTSQSPVTFTDPWQVRDVTADATYTVTVEDVVTPSVESPTDAEDHPRAIVTVRSLSLV